MPWVIWKTERSKEARVAANIQGLFEETYLAMELRTYRHSKQRCRSEKEVPLIPGILFVRHAFTDGLQDVIGHRWVNGLARDAIGAVLIIPDWQMEAFGSMVAQWRENALAARYKPKKGKRPNLHSFEDLKEYFEGLAKLEEAA